jgi:hypothetical protein
MSDKKEKSVKTSFIRLFDDISPPKKNGKIVTEYVLVFCIGNCVVSLKSDSDGVGIGVTNKKFLGVGTEKNFFFRSQKDPLCSSLLLDLK